MPENPILDEIHRHREELARRFDFDFNRIFAYYQQCERERDNSQNPLVDPVELAEKSSVVREEPDDLPQRSNPIIDEIHRHREELARRFDFDQEKIFAYFRECEKKRGADWRLSTAPGESSASRDQSPKE